jgi:ligand-binding sensor domain-containing protein
MNPSDKPTEFRAEIRDGRSRLWFYLIAAAVLVVVGSGVLSRLGSDTDGPGHLDPSATAAAVADATPKASPQATLPPPTPRPTFLARAAPAIAAELAPTGVFVADPGSPGVGSVVPDEDGTVWTSGDSGLFNVDPRTGLVRHWTVSDDPAFASSDLVAAREGGVWLASGSAIRRFDGSRFRSVIAAPAGARLEAEDADGTLWATFGDLGLLQWAHGNWTAEPPGRDGAGATSLAFDAAGRLWTTNYEIDILGYEHPRGISVWDGATWTNFSQDELRPVLNSEDSPSVFATPASGSVWAATYDAVARFDTGGWTKVDVPDLYPDMTLSAVGADGRLWFARTGCDACGVTIQVWDGSTLTTFGSADGLPRVNEVSSPFASVLPGSAASFAATDAGLYELAGARWQAVTGPAASSGPMTLAADLSFPGQIASSSSTTVWAATQRYDRVADVTDAALYRFDGTAWARELAPTSPISRLLVGQDGALWVATDAGPLVRWKDAWVDLAGPVAAASPVGADPTCGGALLALGSGSALYAGPRAGAPLMALQATGGPSSVRIVAPAPTPFTCATELASSPNGTVWLIGDQDGSLWRLSGGTWSSVPLPTPEAPSVTLTPVAIQAGMDGSLWVAFDLQDNSGSDSTAVVAQLIDGQWIRHPGDDSLTWVAALAARPDGSIMAAGDGIAVFDGERWRRSLSGLWVSSISIALDGTVWASGSGVYRLPRALP